MQKIIIFFFLGECADCAGCQNESVSRKVSPDYGTAQGRLSILSREAAAAPSSYGESALISAPLVAKQEMS